MKGDLSQIEKNFEIMKDDLSKTKKHFEVVKDDLSQFEKNFKIVKDDLSQIEKDFEFVKAGPVANLDKCKIFGIIASKLAEKDRINRQLAFKTKATAW